MSIIKLVAGLLIVVLIYSCKVRPDADTQYAKRNEVYKLTLRPQEGLQYHFDINNESEIKLEIDGKKINNISRSVIGAFYEFNKDSSNNLLIAVKYNKIQLYSKNRDQITDLDADNAGFSDNPVEKMLGELKNATIIITATPTGEIKNMSGYEELGAKIFANFNSVEYSKGLIEKQWNQLIGNEIIRKNMDLLFKIYPDSAVHVGDKWKFNSRQEGEIGIDIKSIYSLKEINDDEAIIKIEGEMQSDNKVEENLSAFRGATTDLNGQQEGEYTMDRKTGLPVKGKIILRLKGTIQMMGREIPVEIKTNVEISRKEMKR